MKAKKQEVETDKPAVTLKQYLVPERATAGENPSRNRNAAFVLQTCAAKAKEEFRRKTGLDAGSCSQVAESGIPKEELFVRDFWKEGLNWMVEIPVSGESESQKRYFTAKERAETVLSAKKAAGVRDWE